MILSYLDSLKLKYFHFIHMEYLSFLLYTILLIIITVPVINLAFEFFDIPFKTYGIYLLWFVFIALLNALLPLSQKNIYEKK